MADLRTYSQADLTGFASPITATYTSQALLVEGRAIWKVKLVVGTPTGTSPTLTPQMVCFDASGNSLGVQHPAYTAITAAGTYWFVFDNLDPSNSPVADTTFQLKLVTGGTTPSFPITSLNLYGIKYWALLDQ